ncbi:ubiquitin carboxyl-terminal hydrolase-domain-containing protein [Filobasidium floriforme]|uniref:ubiquitin carboxyl-terminal hydrolase-domain-containing protein n=1 Tax=Filobasidium floriforme TaxID=5210 RepID=UPI001E8EE85A|nr:ubiquitin carboxyl-terminal hydrolase-domain-containing protein [Filobasidium floriforme]KAH8081265.1 ubiquitin carboxyl-terminal hydrolase-domain-containing protein [Filobasidium floriforme]
MGYTPLQVIPPAAATPFDPAPYPTALSFDPYADLLLVGSSSGTVTSYCSAVSLERHAVYCAHGSKGFGTYSTMRMGFGAGEVRQLKVVDKEIWSLTEGGLAGAKRGGLVRWTVSDPLFALRTFDSNPLNSHEIVAGGTGARLTIVNTSQGKVAKNVDQPHSLSHIFTLPRSILTGSPSGLLQILDPRQNYRQVSVLSAPSSQTGGLTGVDVQGDLVAAWGWNVLQGQPTPSSTVSLYDLRTSRMLPPVNFDQGVSWAKLDPHKPSSIVVVSSSGFIDVLDTNEDENSRSDSAENGIQLDIDQYVTALAISPRGDYLAVGDSLGQVQLLTSHDISAESDLVGVDGMLHLPPLNGHDNGTKVEWPDLPMPVPDVKWANRTPLNVIGMPFYDTPLLSNFAPADYATASSPLFNPSKPIPSAVLANMRIIDGVGYAPLPRDMKGKRNVVCEDSSANLISADSGPHGIMGRGKLALRKESGPKFRSERNRRGAAEVLDDEASGLTGLTNGPSMPKHYRKVEIKYSKFGVEDFDFEFYNKTQHSGLETHISNSYTNSLLQAYHYTLPFRACAKAHLAIDCPKEHCMLCESGFLFRMLEDAKGINCQASNFSRAFSATSQAHALGLFVPESEAKKKDFAALIQKFNRWFTNTVAAEDAPTGRRSDSHRNTPPNGSGTTSSLITRVLALKGRTDNACSLCGQSVFKEFSAHVVDMLYPRKSTGTSLGDEGCFASILQNSLTRETTTKTNCTNCSRLTTFTSRRRYGTDMLGNEVRRFPPVLSINASIISDEHLEVWRDTPLARSKHGRKRFLPDGVRIRLGEGGDVQVYDDNDSSPSQPQDMRYIVRAFVASIQEHESDEAHLVAFVRAPNDTDATTSHDQPRWLLFNDFLVKEVSADEALSCAPAWKSPALVVLERIGTEDVLDLEGLPKQIDPTILVRDSLISGRRNRQQIKHTCLDLDEIPSPGTLVAIDAEFIALQLEELEIRSDGTKNVLRPTKMSLARVSVLRGDGARESLPFIDDYIHTSEPVVDYLTEFSGIKEGDLNPSTSIHTLVPLKVAYKKLRTLVDLGCVFVGHGLPKDFRTINIFVPPTQVIDTVAIFYDPSRHRRLSLRFLSWFLLKQDIQTAEHDSIEDARCALQLYKKYQTFVQENRFEDVLEDIYEAGQRLVSTDMA